MGLIFKDDLHDDFGSWAFGYFPYGGADFGEVVAVAKVVGDGGDAAYHEAWVSAAKRLVAEAEDALARGHQTSARELFLRASCFYALSYHPLFGEPVDPKLTAAFKEQIRIFDRGLALFDPPVLPLRIPFEGATLPAYLLPAAGHETETRPLLIVTNGYDATVTDIYFAAAVAASWRGYHCLFFDGPGQGENLFLHGVRLRPDWETVIKSVVDFALTLPNVDHDRIALMGWSLGGYLALRGASGEHRLAACIADPGLFSALSGIRKFATALGVPASAAGDPANIDDATLARMSGIIAAHRSLRWSVIQRGYWVLGAATLREFLKASAAYTLEGRLESLRCPTLLTMADADPLAAGAPDVYAALRCPKELMRFAATEGAGMHCEMHNRSLLNRRVLDWLDTTFQRTPR